MAEETPIHFTGKLGHRELILISPSSKNISCCGYFPFSPTVHCCTAYQHFRNMFHRWGPRYSRLIALRVGYRICSRFGGYIWTLTSRSIHEQPSSPKQMVTSRPNSAPSNSATETPLLGSYLFGFRRWDRAQARSKSFRACEGMYKLMSESSV